MKFAVSQNSDAYVFDVPTKFILQADNAYTKKSEDRLFKNLMQSHQDSSKMFKK